MSDIVKINSKMLEPTELKKLDRLEKELIVQGVAAGKGKKDTVKKKWLNRTCSLMNVHSVKSA